jgi:hypothetical protein
MSKRCLVTVMVLLVGICLSTQAFAGESVKVDGKKLIFPPGDNLSPTDISGLHFKLDGVPADKAYVVGKIWRIALSPLGRSGAVETGPNYLIFTKWEGTKVEIFAYPTQARFKGSQPFVDCVASGTNELQCERRGYTINNSRIEFKPGTFTAYGPVDMLEGDAEVAGAIPLP